MIHLLVEVLVDFPFMSESQHAADYSGVLDRPPQVTDLCPAVFIFHLHHTLCDRKLLFGRANHWPESHLLYFVLLHLDLIGELLIYCLIDRNTFIYSMQAE